MKHIRNILDDSNPIHTHEETPQVREQPIRGFQAISLDQFRFDHLTTEEQVDRLRNALEKARDWNTACRQQPGLSFCITGGVGTGKTTIAYNLMQPFTEQVFPEGLPDVQSEYLKGRLFEATELMKILDDDLPISHHFKHYEIIVVDDVGTEEIPFATERNETTKRQNRYGRFFDYCYKTKKHLVVTSNVPLITQTSNGYEIDSAFMEILGEKALDRLYQMGKGYMCDLTGLPSYRRYIVKDT
ncbi:MAG: hypothetical protein H6658_12410 [Ardenticatenaceae bacterium]|nr:hypothetical protein [Ardenticatenaceae bacterium]